MRSIDGTSVTFVPGQPGPLMTEVVRRVLEGEISDYFAVIYLRRSDADVARPFRVPSVPWVPILGILFCLALMLGLPLVTWLRLIVWLIIGLVIYFAYGRSHSELRNS